MAGMVLNVFPVVSAAVSLLVLLVVTVRFKQRTRTTIPLAPGIDASSEAALRVEISRLAARIADLESESRDASGGAVRSGMNLSKRTQALRLYRLGQGPDTIAKSLDMTQSEVTLLLKVQQIVSRH